MALKRDLARMKEYIAEQLDFDVEEESGLDDLPEEEIEEIYQEMMEKEKQSEQQAESKSEPTEPQVEQKAEVQSAHKPEQKTEPQPTPQPKARTKRQSQKRTRKTKMRSETDEEERRAESLQTQVPPDPLTQYRLLMRQAHDMAKEWAERLGEDYTPFVENSENGFYYGAVNSHDCSLTQFSEIHLPSSLIEQLSLPRKPAKTGTVYKWALAKYNKLLAEAKHMVQASHNPKGGRVEEELDCIIVELDHGYWTKRTTHVIKIPDKIRMILKG